MEEADDSSYIGKIDLLKKDNGERYFYGYNIKSVECMQVEKVVQGSIKNFEEVTGVNRKNINRKQSIQGSNNKKGDNYGNRD